MTLKRNILDLFSDNAIKEAIDTANYKRREIQKHEHLLQELLDDRHSEQDQQQAAEPEDDHQRQHQPDNPEDNSPWEVSGQQGSSEIPPLEPVSPNPEESNFALSWGWLTHLMTSVLSRDELEVWCILRDVGIFSLDYDSVASFVYSLDELACTDLLQRVLSDNCWTVIVQLWIAEDIHQKDSSFSANKSDTIRRNLHALSDHYQHNPVAVDQLDDFGRKRPEVRSDSDSANERAQDDSDSESSTLDEVNVAVETAENESGSEVCSDEEGYNFSF